MNPPPPYPGTRSQGLLATIEESSHRRIGRPGRLAPKWLEDFLSGSLQDSAPLYLDVGCASLDVRLAIASAAGGSFYDTGSPPVVRHELLIKGHQCSGHASGADGGSASTAGTSPGADGKEYNEIYSCVCQNCRYHFTFYIERNVETSCGMNHGNSRDPYHHLVFNPIEDDSRELINTKYYPLWGRSQYICSATRCGYNVTVEVSEPRLNQHFLSFLTDNDRINGRLREAKKAEPERFADVATAPPNALWYLRIYLQDIVSGNEDGAAADGRPEKRISQRNKKFFVHFGDGPDAADLFTFLEFKEVVDGENRLWRVPTPEMMRPTRPGSQLAFYQDIKSEIETILGKDSDNLKPNTAINFITTALDIEKYVTSRQLYSQYALMDYDILGILPDMHESYFWYAFTCQHQADPSKESAFFGALQRLTRGRNNEELEVRVQSFDSIQTAQPLESFEEEDEIRRATEASLKEMLPDSLQSYSNSEDEAVSRAYSYFGLQPDQRTDDEALGKFESLCDSYPSQRSSYREKLLLIARKTGSKRLQERAVESMSLEEAVEYLGVQIDTETEYIVTIAEFSSNSGEKDYALIATALRVVGMARDNNATLIQAAAIIMAGHGQSYEFNSPHDSRMDIATILDSQPVCNLSLPVGLQNIRNTCYLNSILQYFFTVKPIREIVLNWQDWGLEITEENLRHRRIDPGSTRLDPADAFAGRQFAFELSALFTELLTSNQAALKPPQRLALAALKNSSQLEADGAKILAKDRADLPFSFGTDGSIGKWSPTTAPPLPLRHAPAPPVPPRTTQSASKVHVTAISDVDAAETASSRSSQTLVNQHDDAGPTVSYASYSPTEHGIIEMTDAEDGDGNERGTVEVKEDDRMSGVKTVFEPPPTRPLGSEQVTTEEKIERALNDSSVTGTDQQDVEEVMGNIIGHLRAAVRATGEDEETGAQKDPVTDTFFWTSVTYGRTNGAKELSRQVSPNRWVTAYPDENGAVISLPQALDNNFHREVITEGSTRYERFTSILKLPPILHVHIQRTTRDGGKNNTAIEIPQVLYLDRFMDSPVDSGLFRRRRRAWNLQERLRSLKGPNGEVADPYFSPEALAKATAYSDALVAGYLAEDTAAKPESAEMEGNNSESDDGYFLIRGDLKDLMDENGIELPKKRTTAAATSTDETEGQAVPRYDEAPGLSERTRELLAASRHMDREQIRAAWEGASEAVQASHELVTRASAEAETLRSELDGVFAGLQEHEYRLHAVICHAGQTGKSGHYWVWVYDFARQLWRRYNDSVVTEEPDTEKVMRQLSTQGEPYYLAYVRAQDVDQMVDIPSRQAAAEAAEAEEAEAAEATEATEAEEPKAQALAAVQELDEAEDGKAEMDLDTAESASRMDMTDEADSWAIGPTMW
ncbi:ubiquitin c-terminal hydrolase [Grosmannia clavigera kw1407]|uniref:ubiquitinyl hydrolase 1 n=1 Tax=Grosmannia clavigera (strain kw1407 / UAMH 11150) TaxID=655863 RepID=F0XN70_GROCL|nr:ubiquitin c-terminal hydrolase [Grosmannia clavigera kw1407]EFX00765.1 ubiquitin c-terminal hydrolase [Grosmannia clavigera kw1407]